MRTHCGIVAAAALLVAAEEGHSDFRILLRAEALPSGAAGWNRADDRVCVDDERRGRRSLEHRLRDFNSLAGTSDDEIGQVLRTAGERVGSRLVQSAR